MRKWGVLSAASFAAVLIMISVCLLSCSGVSPEMTGQPSSSTPGHVHSFGEWRIVKGPTCTESGSRERVCACGEKETEDVPLTGHTPQAAPEVPPTCTAAGSTGGSVCSVCGEVLVQGQPVPATGHTFGEPTVIKEPTCTEDGYGKRVCHCGEEYTEILPAAGHKPTAVPAVSPTCTEPGLTEGSVCSVCGEVLTQGQLVPATGHTFGEPTVVKEPTCTEDGYGKRVCHCGEESTEVLPAAGHTPTVIPAVSPTCTEPGLTEGSVCSVCGEVLKQAQPVPATGHTFGEPTVVKYPTCTEEGYGERVCHCGETLTEPLPALGHDPVADAAIEAGCTKSGLTEGSHCARCGEILQAQQRVRALGHSPEAIPGILPTCTSQGLSAGRVCSRCGEILQAQVVRPALGHEYGSYTEIIAPTCVADGIQECSCIRCGVTKKSAVPALGHTPQTVKGYPATCTEAGRSDGTRCSSCGAILNAQQVLPAKGHTVVKEEGTSPSCTRLGRSAGSRCSVCETVFEQARTLPATGHDFVDNVCTRCGKRTGTASTAAFNTVSAFIRLIGKNYSGTYRSERGETSVEGVPYDYYWSCTPSAAIIELGLLRESGNSLREFSVRILKGQTYMEWYYTDRAPGKDVAISGEIDFDAFDPDRLEVLPYMTVIGTDTAGADAEQYNMLILAKALWTLADNDASSLGLSLRNLG